MNPTDLLEDIAIRGKILSFGLQTYKYVASSSQFESSNRLFSPVGLHHILCVLIKMTDSKTHQKLLYELLNVPDKESSRDQTQLMWSNFVKNFLLNGAFSVQLALFSTTPPFSPGECIQHLKHSYLVNVFGSTRGRTLQSRVDSWVKQVTVDSVETINVKNAETLALTMVHFSQPFKGENCWSTVKDTFFLSNGETVSVDFLVTEQNLNYYYSEELDAQLIRVDYHLPNHHLLILLPDDLRHLEDIITESEDGGDLLAYSWDEMRETSMILQLPKLVLNSELNVLTFLKETCPNIEHFWIDMKNAKLSFDTVQQQHHFKILQPELDESPPVKRQKNSPVVLNVNRPFLFMVFNRGALMYIGRICDPTE